MHLITWKTFSIDTKQKPQHLPCLKITSQHQQKKEKKKKMTSILSYPCLTKESQQRWAFNVEWSHDPLFLNTITGFLLSNISSFKLRSNSFFFNVAKWLRNMTNVALFSPNQLKFFQEVKYLTHWHQVLVITLFITTFENFVLLPIWLLRGEKKSMSFKSRLNCFRNFWTVWNTRDSVRFGFSCFFTKGAI